MYNSSVSEPMIQQSIKPIKPATTTREPQNVTVANSNEETKDNMTDTIKEWFVIDDEITKMKANIKNKDKRKKILTDKIVKMMKSKSIDCINTSSNGSLLVKQIKSKKSITKKMLIQSLEACMKDLGVAENIAHHILNGREEQIKEVIRRRPIKKDGSSTNATT